MAARWAGRKGRPWRALCARVLAEETHCLRCGKWVDKGLPPRTPMSPTVDHILALALGGAPLDRGNVALAHHGCNSSHGARLGNALRRPQVLTRMIVDVDPHSL